MGSGNTASNNGIKVINVDNSTAGRMKNLLIEIEKNVEEYKKYEKIPDNNGMAKMLYDARVSLGKDVMVLLKTAEREGNLCDAIDAECDFLEFPELLPPCCP